jgi:stage II sporulation protein D
VGIIEKEPSLEISATGEAWVLDGASRDRLARMTGADQVLECRRSGSQVGWSLGGHGGSAASVVLEPVDPHHRVEKDGQEYRGEFMVRPTPGAAGLTLINNIDLENYLKGVVPWEIGRHDREKLAAVEAQAVAARTYTMSHLGARKSRGFDLFASVMDQVYKGSSDEDPLCNEAIANTDGLVMEFEGEEIEAYYSACCGGISSNIGEVWARGERGYLSSREDGPGRDGEAFCRSSRHFHWRTSWTAGRLEEILQKTLPEYVARMTEPSRRDWAGHVFSPRDGSSDVDRPGRLLGLDILSRTTSGRVANMTVTTEAGVYHVKGDRVRWVLAPADGNPFILRSAWFNLELVREGNRLVEIAARGRGFGHGIGMCQTGALGRAEEGQDVKTILGHYYPGARLVKVSARRTGS